MTRWVHEMDEVLSGLSLAFIQLERSGKCCHGVTLSQCHCVDVLSKNEYLTMNELSRRMGLAKSTMTRIVNNMVRQGWIERRAGKGDKRAVTVRLTPMGREMAERLSLSSKEYVRKVLRHIPENKVSEVVESLRRVVESIKKEI